MNEGTAVPLPPRKTPEPPPVYTSPYRLRLHLTTVHKDQTRGLTLVELTARHEAHHAKENPR